MGGFLNFTTNNNLHLMGQCSHWLCNVKFSCLPSIFNKLYAIHGISYSQVIPVVCVFLLNKKKVQINVYF